MFLIMFDIDGTLVSSSKFDVECYIRTAKDLFGVDIPSDINEYKHATDSGILDEIISWFKIPGEKEKNKEKFIKIFNDRISEYIADNPGLVNEIKGASKYIDYLKSLDNVKIALATGCWEETARIKLNAAKINITGIPIASSSDHYIRTEIMKIAENRATGSTAFESKIYFGDAGWDLEASKELGYGFVLVGNRVEYETRITDFSDIDNIMKIINI